MTVRAMTQLFKELKQIPEQLTVDVEVAVTQSAEEVYFEVVDWDDHPYDTGWLVSHWEVSTDGNMSEIGRGPTRVPGSFDAGNPDVPDIRLGDTVYIKNRVYYGRFTGITALEPLIERTFLQLIEQKLKRKKIIS